MRACAAAKTRPSDGRGTVVTVTSMLKLKVATNIPDWDMKLKVIKACSQEIIADNEFGHGKPHWQILTEMGLAIGMKREQIAEMAELSTSVKRLLDNSPVSFDKEALIGILEEAY